MGTGYWPGWSGRSCSRRLGTKGPVCVKHRSASVLSVLALLMETGNRRDGTYDLHRLQRWTAARRIPSEQELRCDLGIDAVPQQVSGQGGDDPKVANDRS